uniref:Uncharacterized protein n=1 Tax=Bracon brevicornis TaxID=1563983 RepID=A0A6V7IJD4_9HYME
MEPQNEAVNGTNLIVPSQPMKSNPLEDANTTNILKAKRRQEPDGKKSKASTSNPPYINKYDKNSKAPFDIYLTYKNERPESMEFDGELPMKISRKHNLGNLHPMEVGEILQ